MANPERRPANYFARTDGVPKSIFATVEFKNSSYSWGKAYALNEVCEARVRTQAI